MQKMPRKCDIYEVGKARNGMLRFWCRAHGANATGRLGVRLLNCEAADHDGRDARLLELDVGAFPGGVALWGAVSPVYDTSGLAPDEGVHVHARLETGGEKVIDETFSAVSVPFKRDLFGQGRIVISQATAVNYYISNFIFREVRHLVCRHCGELHLDAGYFAMHPHKRHLCHSCGRMFNDEGKGVSNPIALARKEWGDSDEKRSLVRPYRVLNVRQADYLGGIRVWASNPAVLWTAKRAEEEGLHVHLYNHSEKNPSVDETFSSVTIDGKSLNEEMAKYLMVQRAIPDFSNKVVSLECSVCLAAHFDRNELAFRPHKVHECEHCGAFFATHDKRQKVVSNPLTSILDILRINAPRT